jgi:hypothetical protein
MLLGSSRDLQEAGRHLRALAKLSDRHPHGQLNDETVETTGIIAVGTAQRADYGARTEKLGCR